MRQNTIRDYAVARGRFRVFPAIDLGGSISDPLWCRPPPQLISITTDNLNPRSQATILPRSGSLSKTKRTMFRTLVLAIVTLLTSANAFLPAIPAYSVPRNQRCGVQMVTSPSVSTPSVTSPAEGTKSSKGTYVETLKKMEADCLKDLENAFEETGKKAQAESDKIWAELNADFAEEEKGA